MINNKFVDPRCQGELIRGEKNLFGEELCVRLEKLVLKVGVGTLQQLGNSWKKFRTLKGKSNLSWYLGKCTHF